VKNGKGRKMQMTDLIVAGSALEMDAWVLTLDADFRGVPGLAMSLSCTEISRAGR
jgi:predicted nucleic acid-binding protein